MILRPGEKIPVDRHIIEGNTSIDESLATGESIPVDKTIRDKVIGATINQQCAVKIAIDKIGQYTFLARIIKLVEDAQETKVPIQAFAELLPEDKIKIVKELQGRGEVVAMVADGSMALSSINVVSNSLRLKRKKI